jgi:hypothetical protein
MAHRDDAARRHAGRREHLAPEGQQDVDPRIFHQRMTASGVLLVEQGTRALAPSTGLVFGNRRAGIGEDVVPCHVSTRCIMPRDAVTHGRTRSIR